MGKITVVDLPEMSLWYLPEEQIVHHQLHRYPGAAVLESSLEKGLETLRKHGAHKWLSDDRKGGALPKSHHDWANNVWGPKAVAAGWKFWALLPPKEVIGSMNMSRLKETYAALGVTVNVFTDLDEAMKWLIACKV